MLTNEPGRFEVRALSKGAEKYDEHQEQIIDRLGDDCRRAG